MNILSHRGSAHSLESTSLGYKSYSALNIAPAPHDFAQNLKGGLPTLKKKHKKTKSALNGQIPFERDIPHTIDPFVQSTGSFSHRPSKSMRKLGPDLNFKKLEEPFPNSDFHSSITMRGPSTAGRSRYDQVESYYHQSYPATAAQTTRGSPREKEKDDLGYVKQEEYIKKNPHFDKFNDTVKRLDRAETMKLSFSKQFFWSAAQVELNEKMLKAVVRRKSSAQQQVHMLKENVKESVQLLQGKTCYYKVRCEDKSFPMLVKITEKAGAFEALVSKSENILHRREYDHIFTTTEARINYDSSHDIKFLYIAINAFERMRMCITVSFSSGEETVKKKIQFRTTDNKSEHNERRSPKKTAYEFFRQGMRNDEFEELKELAEEIKKEKRIRALNLANNKDLIQENIQSAREYQQSKVIHLSNIFEKREHLLKKNRENKVQVKIDKDKQTLLNGFKFKIKRIEQQWNLDEERKRQEEMRYQSNWLVMMALLSLVDGMVFKKKARVLVKIFEKQRETKIIKIQRIVKRFLARPITLKTGEDKHLLDNLAARIAVKMSEAFNGIALTAYKSKVKKAEDLTQLTLEMASVPMGIMSSFEKYISTVIMIQRRWRNQMEMFHARVQVFMALWHQYCLSLITKEMKKKKKKYTELIPQIKEVRVVKAAKKFIQERITIFLREMRDYKQKNGSDENSDETQSAQLDKSFKETEHGDSFTVTRRSSIQKLYKDHDPPIAKKISLHNKPSDKHKSANKAPQLKLFKQLMKAPMKPKLKAKPTEEELKEIFDRICMEIKVASEILH